MSDFTTWLIIGGFLIAFAVVLYLLIAIPMMMYQKREIAAFTELSKKLQIGCFPGKAGLKPNFPVAKGVVDHKQVDIRKAKSGQHIVQNGVRRHAWFLKMMVKLQRPVMGNFYIGSAGLSTRKAATATFNELFVVRFSERDKPDVILGNAMKERFIAVLQKTGPFYVELNGEELITSNFHGLVNDRDVNNCYERIKLLLEIAGIIDPRETAAKTSEARHG